jgi:hypothetical protein
MNATTEHISAQCAARPDIAPYARIVGVWVWVEFDTKPAADTRAFLKRAGFRWNKLRQAWQHPCGVYRPQMKHGDPRAYYGQAPLPTNGRPALPDYSDQDDEDRRPHGDRIADELARFQAL